jgi:hypothetical protein
MLDTALEAELTRQMDRLERRYRETVLRLDRARIEYCQLRLDEGDAARIANAEEHVVDLIDMRDAIDAELERLESLR